MPTQFTINSVNYANAASGSQTMTFEYKLWSDPESAYVLISNSAVVNTAGVLAVPLLVSGLVNGELYHLRQSNNCSSPIEYFVTSISLT